MARKSIYQLSRLGIAFVAAVGISLLATLPALSQNTAQPSAEKSVIAPEKSKQRKMKLDELFGRLKIAKDSAAGAAIVKQIWETWFASGNVDVDALMNQARLAVQEGGIEEAFGALDRVIEIAPDYPEGWNRRATLNFMLGRHERSVRDIQQTLAREPRHFGALSGLSQILAAAGKWKGALKAYERALAVNPFLPNKDAILRQLREKALGSAL
ncbi:MAG: tetratricopeptide repeat protein [Pseudomonadota bacterium]